MRRKRKMERLARAAEYNSALADLCYELDRLLADQWVAYETARAALWASVFSKRGPRI